MKTAFVTCGATAPFPQLIDSVLTDHVLTILNKTWGVQRVVIQHGALYSETQFKDTVSKVFQDTQYTSAKDNSECRELGCPSLTSAHVTTTVGNSLYLVGIAYSSQVTTILSNADTVVAIAHAGTGSILDAFGAQVPLCVVPNPYLQDNHQQEIAIRLSKMNRLTATERPTSKDLAVALLSLHDHMVNASHMTKDESSHVIPQALPGPAEFCRLLAQTATE
ncbi:hypothetical protein TBLA_0B09870 [Henningerozyma blattae CBS 6284]|uniref:UDP-N-acetylglucosamine transferase subunit ALG13 n=1 Tax=Henningerozyma blattae (strain ATCC 34711 / CBS 6284 / DSM 70876 / NBRC 10599 / NRRL Y-10934 / UCD 77-7) TaxID=1071380 RepID=I2H0A3_HENB6|nr:hypothetical protein TBLA_0B09870 [Tetrapisispora blattae CBS 6284]CCH59805.1 hypothetical protein TBLA_0B09870 [Tetrapisispora blattae CBS 6284]